MDKQKSILNVTVSITFKVITAIVALVGIRLLIRCCGNEVNGLNSLYQSILGFLSVAELGVGTAITFCMYRPIVEKDHDKVSALYHLFRRMYLIVGGAILLLGLMITPFLRYFAKDYAQIDVDLHLTFILMLVSVVISYLFGAKTALINAYKNNYITTAINSGGILLQSVLQIIVLTVFRSFTWYLVCRIAAVLVQWAVTEVVAEKKYAHLTRSRKTIDPGTRRELVKNIKAMFMHKVGDLLVNTADSIVISMFIGVAVLGKYTNYAMILSSMTGIIILVFTQLTSVFGHLYAEKSKETVRAYCEMFHLINYMIGTVFYLGYFAVVDNLIAILFSADLVVEKELSMVIAFNGFTQFTRQSTLAFREATGTFYHDRWKPLYEGLVNVAMSVILVGRIGVRGVIVATIITNMVICHIVEPYVLYRYAFSSSPVRYYVKNYGMTVLFGAALLVLGGYMQSRDSQWLELLVNGSISIAVSLAACAAMLLMNRGSCKHAFKIIKNK